MTEFSTEKFKYEVNFTSAMKKDFKRIKKRGYNTAEFAYVVRKLADGEPLEEKFQDHELKGDWKNHRECHIRPDWLLIYQVRDNVLVLELSRTGTHADLFGK